jgi:hypothetical protein
MSVADGDFLAELGVLSFKLAGKPSMDIFVYGRDIVHDGGVGSRRVSIRIHISDSLG